jgi:transcriptional regulator with XRE-family HTH domain|tara:strand:- start:288 stop:629 length:342 start_codon:yes stop_codon:yes gene_type:complete
MTSQKTETFGELIRRLRQKENYTLTQLAAKLGVDSANLSKIETGKREFDVSRIQKLAKALNQKEDLFFNELLSERVAKSLYQLNNYQEILVMAEDKIKYLTQSKVEQGKPQIT